MADGDADVQSGDVGALANATTCRIVTRGRATGREHVVTVWFALVGTTVYAASRSGHTGDRLRNAVATSRVMVGLRGRRWPGTAHVVTEPAEVERALDALTIEYARHRAVVDAWRADPPVLVGIELASGGR